MLTGHYSNHSRPIPDKNKDKNTSFTWLGEGGVHKTGGCLKKWGCHFFHANTFQYYLFLIVWCACVVTLFTPFLSVLFVSQKDLTLIEYNQQI